MSVKKLGFQGKNKDKSCSCFGARGQWVLGTENNGQRRRKQAGQVGRLKVEH